MRQLDPVVQIQNISKDQGTDEARGQDICRVSALSRLSRGTTGRERDGLWERKKRKYAKPLDSRRLGGS